MRMEVNNFSTNRLLLSSSPATLSSSHLVAVYSGVSWVTLLCCARLISSRRASLWSGVSWVSLFCFARLTCSRRASLRSGVSWVRLLCCARLICLRWASLWSGVSWVSLLCCARLICSKLFVLWSEVSNSNRPLLWSETLSRWAADREARWALSLTLHLANRASLCWALSAARRSLSRWFLRLTLSLLRIPWVNRTYFFLTFNRS